MTDLKTDILSRTDTMLDLLRTMVEFESPTHDKAAVDRLINWLASYLNQHGAQDTTRYDRQQVGDILLAKWNIAAQGKPILILVHVDTVWSVGTLEKRPIHIEESRFYGAGAQDMKGGIVIALTALDALQQHNQLPDRPIWMLFTTDEEEGSKYSRQLIEELAQQCALVLVMEPPNADGSLKTWRKGIARYQMTVTGRAAHAGNEPEQGVNAIIEFAQQALELNRLNDYKNGTSVSVTTVQGGTVANTIPDYVTAAIDVRMMSMNVYNRLKSTIMDRMSYIPGSQITVEELHVRPPMERNPHAFDTARQIAREHHITIREDGAGGGSDGNFTAALGIPTLDGLGAHGAGLHAEHEHILINPLAEKAYLVACLIQNWQNK